MPTFDQLQKSRISGRPLEFYKFANDATDFRYSSSTETITYLSEEYVPAGITRQKTSQSTNVDKADLTLTIPKTADLVREYRRAPRSAFWLTLFRVHFGETETKQLWQGRVLDIATKGELATITLESILKALNRQGRQDDYGSLCANALYDGIGCPVQKALHARPATVTDIDGDNITVTGLAAFLDEWFEGGVVEIADGDQRDVTKSVQSTGVLTLTRYFSSESLQIGDPVTVYDGCKHRHQEDCIGKFGAETNNGESCRCFPYGGSRNPFKTGVQ